MNRGIAMDSNAVRNACQGPEGRRLKRRRYGNAYMKKSAFVQKQCKNGAKMSILYICMVTFSMYANVHIAYNIGDRTDGIKNTGRR